MNRRHLILGLSAAAGGFAQTSEANLSIADIIVGEYSTSLRLPDNFGFASGMTVFLSFRVAGLKPESELSLVSFEYVVEALDAIGTAWDVPIKGRVTRRIATEAIAPAPLVRATVKVPDYIYPANGKFRIRVTDRFSKREVSAEVVIPIRSELPKPTDVFSVANLGLYRRESDETPLKDATFRPGDSVWMRFLLTGFRWKDREYDLSYGISILSRDKRVVLSAPDAAAESNSSPYQRPFVPALASIRLEGTAKPGDYILVVRAKDSISGTTAEASAAFRIAG